MQRQKQEILQKKSEQMWSEKSAKQVPLYMPNLLLRHMEEETMQKTEKDMWNEFRRFS